MLWNTLTAMQIQKCLNIIHKCILFILSESRKTGGFLWGINKFNISSFCYNSEFAADWAETDSRSCDSTLRTKWQILMMQLVLFHLTSSSGKINTQWKAFLYWCSYSCIHASNSIVIKKENRKNKYIILNQHYY